MAQTLKQTVNKLVTKDIDNNELLKYYLKRSIDNAGLQLRKIDKDYAEFYDGVVRVFISTTKIIAQNMFNGYFVIIDIKTDNTNTKHTFDVFD